MAAVPAHACTRLILLAAVLQTVVHPGIFAGAMQDCTTHLYELKDSLVVDERSESHELDHTYGHQAHGWEQGVHRHGQPLYS